MYDAMNNTIEDDAVGKVLCEILGEGIDIHRCQAAQALGHIGGEKTVEALLGALLDEDEDVRTDAAAALAQIADPKADKQLLENLIGDPCSDVKMSAIDALVKTRNGELVPWLLRILKGRDQEIVWEEDELQHNDWDDWLDFQVKAMDALAELGIEEAVPGIAEAINGEDAQDLSEIGFKALGRLGDPGAAIVAGFLDDADERRRRRAAAVLARLDGPVAEKGTISALQDKSKEVRLAAAIGLAERNPSDEKLRILFLDPEPEVRARAVTLCAAHHPEGLETLIDDKSPSVRCAVLDLLSKRPELMQAGLVMDRVRGMLDGDNPKLSASAAVALAVLDPVTAQDELREILVDTEKPEEIRRAAVRGISMIGGDEALESLIGVLADDTRQIRLDAMSAIADFAKMNTSWPNRAGDALLDALRGVLVPEPEPEPSEEETLDTAPEETPEEEHAAEAESTSVGEDETDDSFPTSTLDAIVGSTESAVVPMEDEGVELTLEDMEFLSLANQGKGKGKKRLSVVPETIPHEDVRLFAARLLGGLHHEDVARALIEPLAGENNELKLVAGDSLAQLALNLPDLPDDVADAIIVEARSPLRDLRLNLFRALGSVKDERVTMVLLEGLEDEDSFVRTAAIDALSRLGEAGPGMGKLLEDADPAVRLAAAHAMGNSGVKDAVEELVEFAFAFEGYHGNDAARILRGLDKRAANALFVEALGDEDRKRYWKVAIEALQELNRNDAPSEMNTQA